MTNGRFKFIHNSYPDLPNTPSADAMRSPTWTAMQNLHANDQLTQSQSECFRPRSEFEFYDRQSDPFEIINRIDDPQHKLSIHMLKTNLTQWQEATKDFLPSKRTPDEFDRLTGAPDNAIRQRPRPSKLEMFGKNGAY